MHTSPKRRVQKSHPPLFPYPRNILTSFSAMAAIRKITGHGLPLNTLNSSQWTIWWIFWKRPITAVTACNLAPQRCAHGTPRTVCTSLESKITAKNASLSGMVTAVLVDYLDLSFAQGGLFPNDSNMPFLVLNQYAAQYFLDENKNKVTLSVNDTMSMTIGEEDQTAILCGVFEDGLEQPVIYMSYTLAARLLPKGDSIKLLFRLGKTEDMESGAKTLKKMGVSVSYDEALPQRWKLTKQQICQTFLSALVLLLCSVVQIAGQHKREQMESLPEWQGMILDGLKESDLRWIFPLRVFCTDLLCLLIAAVGAGVMESASTLGILVGGLGSAVHFGIVIGSNALPWKHV